MVKVYRILEIVWLLIAIASLVTGIVIATKYLVTDSYLFFSLGGVALVMFYLRRRQRIKFTQKQNAQNNTTE